MNPYALPILCIALCIHCLTGCYSYQPIFEKNIVPATARHSAQESHAQMVFAWRGLRDEENLDVLSSRLDQAWSHDPGYYEPVWGWGIFRLVQAGHTKPSSTTIRHLNDSIRCFYMARNMKSFPEEERANLDMDIANSYNAMGACYIQMGNQTYADTALDCASSILNEINPKTKIESARYFELLAYNKFYKGNIEDAKAAATRALDEGAMLSEYFLSKLSIEGHAK